ncbi:hypothetical protein HPB47_008964 [Ixodes persulcatus]|uniref:Uncharacterized protein n=1 Tax=Ixodes persulcatus TaxID=34615 RepID=A0AC60P3B7_IXOPE|nr:hypothetical protein HPB47_008964 [Ixodes persulcatus]
MAHTGLLDASETECPRTPDRPYPGIEVSQDMPFLTTPESTTATVPLVRSGEVDINQNLTSSTETITGLKVKANGCDTMNDAVNRTYAQRLGELEKSIQRLEDGARRDDPNLREEICQLRDKVAELELRVEQLEKKPRSPSAEMELNPPAVGGGGGGVVVQAKKKGGRSCSCWDAELFLSAAVEAIYEIRNSTDVGKETEDEVSEGSHTDVARYTDDFQESPHNSGAFRDCTVKFAPERHVPNIAEKRMDSIQPTMKEEQIRPPPGIQREIIIAGDGNVARIARALIEEIRAPQSLEYVMNRTATTQVVHELLETYEEEARSLTRLYTLHVGVNDILRGEQTDAIVERLRMKWTNRKASLAICSVPESVRRGKRIHAATMLLNARLKQLCRSIKARFIDLSRELTNKEAMQKDGLQYGEECIPVVTERLGAVASHFLGLRRRDKDLRLKTQVKGHQPPLSNQSEYILQPQSEQLTQVPTFLEIRGGHARQRELSNVNSGDGSTCIPGVTPFPWVRPAAGRHDATGGLKATDGEEVWAYYGLRKGKHGLDRSHSVLLMGDFNGHLVELKRREDKKGQMLRQLAEYLELEILNLREECEGKHIWMVRYKKTCIDYALALKSLTNRLQKIVVNDNGELSVGSDDSTTLLHSGAIQRHRRDIEAVCQDFEESEQRMIAATYEEYATELRQAVAKRSVPRSAQGKRRLVPWWDAEIGRAIRYRQDTNQEHRQALKSFGKGSETLQLWEEYQRRNALTQAIVEKKKQAHDCREMADIRKGEKKAGEKFWRYIGSLDEKDSSPQLVDPDNGSEVKNIKELLGEYLYTSTTADQNATVVGRVQVERALARLNGSTAQGLEGISAKVLKSLGPDAREHLAHLFSQICCGDDPTPSDWRRGRVSFIPETGGNKQLLHDYRPLTVTPVAYRVFATIINGRITQRAEEIGLLTELQNGFRRGRRLEDNLFTLTQKCIEIARKEKRPVITCFHDIARAYDCILHTMLLKRLKQLNMPETWVTLVQRLYDKNVVTASFNGVKSDEVTVEKELRQGCPLSPTLYMLYESSMERALEKTAIVFPLTHLQHGEVIAWRLLNLHTLMTLKLLATCETEADQLQLHFNAHKSATVIFSREEESIEPFILQGAAIPVCTKYRYLGVTLSTTENYLTEYHQNLRRSSVVAVPGLTFGNSVIGIPSELREYLERRQRDVGRQALGCHGQVANELVEGDVGWSSFEAREANSKLQYYARLRHMDEDRWNIHSTWRNRVTRLGTKFGAFCMSDEPQAEKDWRWTLGMQQHTSMHLYASFKTEIAPITFCRNTLGSRLLIETCGGALRTRHVCGEDEETTEHLLLTCQRLLPAPIGDSRIEQALGFTNEHDHVAGSRQRLEAWWKVRR